MNDSTPRTALVAASWLSLLVAVLSMSVPYVEFSSGKRSMETMREDYRIDTAAGKVFLLPGWAVTAISVIVLLALVIKELAMSDAAAKAAINLSTGVLMLVVGSWLAMIVRAALPSLMDPLAIGG